VDWWWVVLAVAAFAACTFIPIKMYSDDERKRNMINWLILIPVSLVIIFYVYPIGIRFFENLATHH